MGQNSCCERFSPWDGYPMVSLHFAPGFKHKLSLEDTLFELCRHDTSAVPNLSAMSWASPFGTRSSWSVPNSCCQLQCFAGWEWKAPKSPSFRTFQNTCCSAQITRPQDRGQQGGPACPAKNESNILARRKLVSCLAFFVVELPRSPGRFR